MATDIVGSLFGVDPAAYQLAQQKQAYNQDYQAVQLDPIQQANLALRQGGRGIGQAVGGLLGMQDPELAKMSQIKQLASQFDLSSPEGLRQFSAALRPFAPEESIRAAQVADEREKSGLGLRETKAKIEKAELSAAQEEKLRAELSALPPNASEQQVIEVVRKYGSPDKILQILTASQDRAAARAVAAANRVSKPLPAGLQKDELKDLEAIDNYTAQSSALIPSIANLSPNDKGVSKLTLSPTNNAKYITQNALGNSTDESRAYAALKSAVDTAVNLQVSAEKGVQTDKDVERFARALVAAYGQNDTKATLEALKRYNDAIIAARNKAFKRVESRRKSQGVESYAESQGVPFETTPAPEAPQKKTRKLKSGVEVTVEG